MQTLPLTQKTKQEIFEPSPIVKNLIKRNSDLITKIEKKFQIPNRYLIPHLAIHLPRFSREELDQKVVSQEATRIAKKIQRTYNNLDEKWQKLLHKKKEKAKIKFFKGQIYIVNQKGNILNNIYFNNVSNSIGNFIQNKLHYIQKARSDTKFHLGFYTSNQQEIPFAYASFSVLDRNYLANSLPVSLQKQQVLVMTRAFGFNFVPHNSMSALFHCCYKFFEKNFKKYKAIVTALNPNLLFKGSVFKGSSYFPFALSPLQLIYHKGNYVTRRFCRSKFDSEDINSLGKDGKITRAKIKTKDILWLIRGITPELQQKVRNLRELKKITEREYLSG